MALVETFDDVVFEQDLLVNPHVYYTDDRKFKVIVSSFLMGSKFVSMSYNPNTNKPPDIKLATSFLHELGLDSSNIIPYEDDNSSVVLNPGVLRFICL